MAKIIQHESWDEIVEDNDGNAHLPDAATYQRKQIVNEKTVPETTSPEKVEIILPGAWSTIKWLIIIFFGVTFGIPIVSYTILLLIIGLVWVFASLGLFPHG